MIKVKNPKPWLRQISSPSVNGIRDLTEYSSCCTSDPALEAYVLDIHTSPSVFSASYRRVSLLYSPVEHEVLLSSLSFCAM